MPIDPPSQDYTYKKSEKQDMQDDISDRPQPTMALWHLQKDKGQINYNQQGRW